MKIHWVKDYSIPCDDKKSLASGHKYSYNKERVTCKKCIKIIKKEEKTNETNKKEENQQVGRQPDA